MAGSNGGFLFRKNIATSPRDTAQSLGLGEAIQSQSPVHLCNAVVRVRHQRPATPALAGQSNSFSLLRPQSSPLLSFMQQDCQRVKLGHCPANPWVCFFPCPTVKELNRTESDNVGKCF